MQRSMFPDTVDGVRQGGSPGQCTGVHTEFEVIAAHARTRGRARTPEGVRARRTCGW